MDTLLDGKRVFFVEDDGKNIAIIFSILKKHGAEVKFTPWRYAVDTIKEFKPDVILLDMMLPGNVTGFDVFESIREDPDLQDIPISAVTALEDATAMNKAREMGFDGYILKPVRVQTFPEYVEALIRGEQVWGELET